MINQSTSGGQPESSNDPPDQQIKEHDEVLCVSHAVIRVSKYPISPMFNNLYISTYICQTDVDPKCVFERFYDWELTRKFTYSCKHDDQYLNYRNGRFDGH
jgi:hypothetical protein